MRNLTVKRAKTFVACLAKANVYIEDEKNYDLIINNTPCRKLGTLKNGEEKTFEISEASARVYVIADKLSKGFCNEFVEIPYGEEDVTLTGKNRFNIATGNAFRFDGEVSEEVLANRRKSTRRGAIVMVIAGIVGFIIGFMGTSTAFGNGLNGEPKDFSASGMAITLTDNFELDSVEGYALACKSDKVIMFALRESFAEYPVLEDYTVREYADAANRASTLIQSKDSLTYFEYDALNGNDYHYFAFVYKTEDAFWLVQFGCRKSVADDCREYAFEWAKSVKFD
ncbi:MAG: hypothetical protein IJX27_02225 [Clostridia bacterium]|nr:hypothetical protein [Clostridia bacterium]